MAGISTRKENMKAKKNDVKLCDVMCPICLCILMEPVKLACGHELCMQCLEEHVQKISFTCPFCRIRIGNWMRKTKKENSLVNVKRWNQIRRSFPKEVEDRLCGNDSCINDDVDEGVFDEVRTQLCGRDVLDGKIYIVGGFNEIEYLDTAEVYDPDGDTWSEITPMTGRRCSLGCVGHGGFVYALGGSDGQGRLDSVERYNPSTHIWTRVSDMTRARGNFAVQIVENKIFVIGGFDGRTSIDDVECYDANEDRWQRVCSMEYDRAALSTFVLSNDANLSEYMPQNRQYNRTER